MGAGKVAGLEAQRMPLPAQILYNTLGGITGMFGENGVEVFQQSCKRVLLKLTYSEKKQSTRLKRICRQAWNNRWKPENRRTMLGSLGNIEAVPELQEANARIARKRKIVTSAKRNRNLQGVSGGNGVCRMLEAIDCRVPGGLRGKLFSPHHRGTASSEKKSETATPHYNPSRNAT